MPLAARTPLRACLLALPLALPLAALLPLSALAGEVAGTVTYRDRALLPPGATLTVTIEDISRADAPSAVLAETEQIVDGGPPFPFTITYDDDAVDPRARYSLSATVRHEGELVMRTTTVTPILTGEDRHPPELLMSRTGSSRNAAADEGPALPLQGELRYLADAATFTDCRSGEAFPVATEGAYFDAELAYLTLGTDGAPVVAVLDGYVASRSAMEGPDRDHLIIQRFVRMAPELTCARALADSELINTYWKILELGDAPAPTPPDGRREPHLILRTGDVAGFSATVGCNSFAGGFQLAGDGLAFGPGPATLMACPPPLDIAEELLRNVLAETAGWRITGTTLELTDASGAVVLLAEAVYLR
ncbi:MAG: YbaY family lipoprotein [Pseudomonadota bacterium]